MKVRKKFWSTVSVTFNANFFDLQLFLCLIISLRKITDLFCKNSFTIQLTTFNVNQNLAFVDEWYQIDAISPRIYQFSGPAGSGAWIPGTNIC